MLTALQGIGEQFGAWYYLVAGLVVFAEAAVLVGLVLPGEIALLAGGFAAHQGWLHLWPMVGVGIGSAVLGDSVGYVAGRVLGPRLRCSWVGRRVGDRRWHRGEELLNRHGGKAVLLGRFTAVLRALTPGLAGLAGLPYLRTFLLWNVVGAVLWGGGCVLLGYGFSASLGVAGRYLAYGPVVLGAVVLGGYLLLRRRRPPSSGPAA